MTQVGFISSHLLEFIICREYIEQLKVAEDSKVCLRLFYTADGKASKSKKSKICFNPLDRANSLLSEKPFDLEHYVVPKLVTLACCWAEMIPGIVQYLDHRDEENIKEEEGGVDKKRKGPVTPKAKSPAKKQKKSGNKVAVEKEKNIMEITDDNPYLKPDGTKKRRKYTDVEKDAIRRGVQEFGVGKWAKIKEAFKEELLTRTGVNIKVSFPESICCVRLCTHDLMRIFARIVTAPCVAMARFRRSRLVRRKVDLLM